MCILYIILEHREMSLFSVSRSLEEEWKLENLIKDEMFTFTAAVCNLIIIYLRKILITEKKILIKNSNIKLVFIFFRIHT